MAQLSKIVPLPQSEVKHGGKITLGTVGAPNSRILLKAKKLSLANEAYELLAQALKAKLYVDAPEKADVTIVLEVSNEVPEEIKKNPDQAYKIVAKGKRIVLTGYGERGLYYATRSLIQTFEYDGHTLTVPKMTVIDYPDMKTRGHFVESYGGTCFMELDDWKNFIDKMADMKLNQMAVSIYGCWGFSGEFLYVDIPHLPKLLTTKGQNYYSVKNKKYVTKRNIRLPIAEKDFFGDIIAYGKKRGIEVFPLWNSYGHNTLLPRMYPEVAPTVDGEKSPIGLCTSSDKTYEVLFSIYDYIIDKYLKPYGIESFHIGLDEVRAERVNPQNLEKEYSPFCECEKCKNLTNQEKAINHTLRIAKHLKEKGIKNIYMFNDLPSRIFPDPKAFADAFKANDLLDNVVIDWWSYDDNPKKNVVSTTYPELNIRSTLKHWNGFYHATLPETSVNNVIYMSNIAIRDNAEGVQSYASTDDVHDINNVAIASYSWNFNGTGSRDDYYESYAYANFPHQFELAKRAFGHYAEMTKQGNNKFREHDKTLGNYNVLDYVQYKTYNIYDPDVPRYPRRYPGIALERMLTQKDYYISRLHEVRKYANDAYEAMSKLTDPRDNYLVAKRYATAARLYRDLADDMLALHTINDLIESDDKNKRVKIMKLCEKRKLNRIDAMAIQESFTEDFILAPNLQNQSVYMQFFADLEAYARSCTNETFALDLHDTDDVTSEQYMIFRGCKRTKVKNK